VRDGNGEKKVRRSRSQNGGWSFLRGGGATPGGKASKGRAGGTGRARLRGGGRGGGRSSLRERVRGGGKNNAASEFQRGVSPAKIPSRLGIWPESVGEEDEGGEQRNLEVEKVEG